MRLLRDPEFWVCVVIIAGIGLGMGLGSPWPIVGAVLACVAIIGAEWWGEEA